MDSSVTSYLLTIAIDVLIFCIIFCIYISCHKYRSGPYTDARNRWAEAPPPVMYEESTMGCLQVWKKVWKVTDEELADTVGIEAVLYLKLQRIIAVMLGGFAVLGMAVLSPLYYIGNGDADTQLQQLTISNLDSEDYILGIAPVIALITFSVIAYLFIFRYVKTIRSFSKRIKA